MRSPSMSFWHTQMTRPKIQVNYLEGAPEREVQEMTPRNEMPYIRNQTASQVVQSPRSNNVGGTIYIKQERVITDATYVKPGPSSQPSQTQGQNTNETDNSTASNPIRKKPKKTRKPRTTSKTILSEPLPPGFLTVSTSITSKRANSTVPSLFEKTLQVDKDVIITLRMYKNFTISESSKLDAVLEGLSYTEYEFSGRNYVSDIMEHFVCGKESKDQKGILPGFFFIKDMFYVDKNQRSTAQLDNIRNHVEARDLGAYSKKDMCTTALMDLEFKLGLNDLFIHGTSCEHIIVFSQMRLLQPNDLNQKSDYPRKTMEVKLTMENAVCFFCREVKPDWIVSACARIQYHVAIYCENCYKSNLFDKDGEPICKFNTLPYTDTEPMLID